MAEFTAGTQIMLTNGDKAAVKQQLGAGGQGSVYRVTIGGKDYALKWYHNNVLAEPERFYKNIANNIAKLSPTDISKGSPRDSFLWPLFLTEWKDGSFGYIMNLRPGNYKDFAEFLLARVRFGSIAAVINACLNTVHGFRKLHNDGFSYQDLNDGNFFIDPDTGDVLICDNDNVAPYGTALGIAGKAGYMAPEVVRSMSMPNNFTDRFSLAVILFKIMFMDHPLEGQRTTVPALTEYHDLEFFGKNPVFIYDKTDASNRPVRGVHKNVDKFWALYPEFVKEAFHTSFTKEYMQLDGANKRITGTAWQAIFTQLRDMLIECPCEGETFCDPDKSSSKCIFCGIDIPCPCVLETKKYKVVLFPGKKLCKCHTDRDSDDYVEICGEVIRNKDNLKLWGIRNLKPETWTVTKTDGGTRTLAKGEVMPIMKGMSIDFGKHEGKII